MRVLCQSFILWMLTSWPEQVCLGNSNWIQWPSKKEKISLSREMVVDLRGIKIWSKHIAWSSELITYFFQKNEVYHMSFGLIKFMSEQLLYRHLSVCAWVSADKRRYLLKYFSFSSSTWTFCWVYLLVRQPVDQKFFFFYYRQIVADALSKFLRGMVFIIDCYTISNIYFL